MSATLLLACWIGWSIGGFVWALIMKEGFKKALDEACETFFYTIGIWIASHLIK